MSTNIATIRREGTAHIAVVMPFDTDAKNALKDAIPHADRTPVYQPAFHWLVAPQHLDTVRALVAEHAAANGWTVEDYTARSANEIAAERAAADVALRQQHIAAFLAVLPQLPRHSLALVAYDDRRRTWQLELRQHLGEDLFRTVIAASLRGRRETMLGSWEHKRSWGFKLEIAADEHILRALIARGDVDHLKVYPDLRVVAQFDDGMVVHLEAPDGTMYVGGSLQNADLSSWNHGSASWPFAALPEGVFVVFAREAYIRDVLTEASHG